MIRFAILLILSPLLASASPKQAAVEDIVDNHILPAFARFEAKAATLDSAAAASCAPDDVVLRAAYQGAYDAWAGAAHLQIGPMETTDLSFAVLFWPDPKSKTPKALSKLIQGQDPSVGDAEEFAENSVAARGLLALERMLFDDAYREPAGYACALTRAIARDINRSARLLNSGFREDYALQMRAADNALFPNHEDALRKLYTVLMTTIAFNAEARVARPLGTLKRPRPKRAEAWRSGRSLRTLRLSIEALADLAGRIAAIAEPVNADQVNATFAELALQIDELDQPVFNGPGEWLDIDLLRQSIEQSRGVIDERIGPDLGLFVAFNARDGD